MIHSLWSKSLALVAASTLVVGFAHAEEAAPAEAAEGEAAAPAPASVEVSDTARQHFKTGVALLQDPDGARYEEAYREFKAAYADSPSWKILGNLGITAMKLERDGEAIWAFEKYLAEGGDAIDPAERGQFERDLATTKSGVVYVTLESSPPGAVFIDERIPLSGRPVVNRYDAQAEPLKIGVRRGKHRITAKMGGRVDAVWEIDASPGDEQSHVFELAEPTDDAAASTPIAVPPAHDTGAQEPEMIRPVPTSVYIGLAATGALAIGGGVVGVLAMGKKSDFDDANDGSDPDGAQEIRDSGTQLNLIADALFGGAVVAGVVTAVLYFNRPSVPAEQDTALRVAPTVGPGGAAVSVTGAF